MMLVDVSQGYLGAYKLPFPVKMNLYGDGRDEFIESIP